MPQIVLEHSDNLPIGNAYKRFLSEIHAILNEECGIPWENCKSRCYQADQYLVGRGDRNAAFVHLSIRVLEGRPLSQIQKTGDRILKYLSKALVPLPKNSDLQVTVEINDIEIGRYFKYPAGTLSYEKK